MPQNPAILANGELGMGLATVWPMTWPKLSLVVTLAIVSADAHATSERLENIEAVVRDSLAVDEGSYQIYGLDSALSVPRCSEPLQGWARNVTATSATVDVVCSGTQPWRIYVPVRLQLVVEVVTANVALPRGATIERENITVVKRPAHGLPASTLSRPTDVVGKTLRRGVQPGQIIVAGALDEPVLVARGQTVTLISQLPGIMVKSSGIAVEDGRLGQRVRIRAKSKQIIEGRVLAADTVSVGTK